MKKEAWIKKNSPRLLNFIKQSVENEQDVADILQETLISASDCLPLFSGKSSFFTWLCGIAKHEIADFYRKKKVKTFFFSHLPWLENLASEALGPEQILMRREMTAEVKKTLKRLSEGYSQVLRLKYYHGFSVAEIAQKLNQSVKAIESRLSRARQAFAQVYLADLP
jgi:RNA polymerase sigma-70 factor (ECF subfamily)